MRDLEKQSLMPVFAFSYHDKCDKKNHMFLFGIPKDFQSMETKNDDMLSDHGAS